MRSRQLDLPSLQRMHVNFQRYWLSRLTCSSFFQDPVGENAGVHAPAEDRKEKVPSPHLSQMVVLTNSGSLYGLAQRVVATESL